MQLGSIRINEKEVAAIRIEDHMIPLPSINKQFDTTWKESILEILNDDQLDELNSWFKHLNKVDLLNEIKDKLKMGEVKFGPLYRHPKKIWGIGLNYVDHASDLSEKAPTTEPASFMKADTTIIGPGDLIKIPFQSEKTTGEAELGVIIKKKSKNVPGDKWLDVVAGFTTIIDMTAEDILRKNPRYLTLSKNFDTFFSFGPLLLTPDEIPDIMALKVATVINRKVHAQNTISNMTFPPEFLVSFHSEVMTMLPGDIISTGTPRAVHIQEGDIIECHIDGFPALKNPVIDLKKESEL